MSKPEHRVEIEYSVLVYRGDRDERLTELKVTGWSRESHREAFRDALMKLVALGYDPRLMMQERLSPEETLGA